MSWLALLQSKSLWLVVALVAGLLELFTMTGFLLGFAAGALLVYGLLWVWPALPPVWLVLIFAVSSVAASYAYLRVFRRFNLRTDAPALNDRLARNIGRSASVVEEFADGSGLVKIDDGLWRAVLESPEVAPVAGSHVTVVAVQGDRLVVRAPGG